jgi:hypothetical protein
VMGSASQEEMRARELFGSALSILTKSGAVGALPKGPSKPTPPDSK